jgi:phage-related tail fiber protein
VGADNAGRTPGAGIPEGSEELPGYWLLFSLDNGANVTAIDSLTPVGAGPSTNPIVPNTVGVTSVSATGVSLLGGTWNAGSTLVLRWIDDNAIDPSPDEIIGLDNVRIAVPEPAGLTLVAAALAAGAAVARHRR